MDLPVLCRSSGWPTTATVHTGGLYEWDGPHAAEQYARALWRVLALVSVPGSIDYQGLPGVRRDELLAQPSRIDTAMPVNGSEWWRLIEAA